MAKNISVNMFLNLIFTRLMNGDNEMNEYYCNHNSGEDFPSGTSKYVYCNVHHTMLQHWLIAQKECAVCSDLTYCLLTLRA